jgi:hypothetical protein
MLSVRRPNSLSHIGFLGRTVFEICRLISARVIVRRSTRTAGPRLSSVVVPAEAANGQKTSAKAVIAMTPKHINAMLIGSKVRSLNMADSRRTLDAPYTLRVLAEDGAIVSAAWPRCDNSQEENVIAGAVPPRGRTSSYSRSCHFAGAAPILTNKSRLPRAGKKTWYSFAYQRRIIESD